MSNDKASPEFLELEFIEFMAKLTDRIGLGEVSIEPFLARMARVDVTIGSGSTIRIVECKRITPQTRHRLDGVIEKLQRYKQAAIKHYESQLDVELILAIPGTLSQNRQSELRDQGITVWDAEWITDKSVLAGLTEEATHFLGDHTVDDSQLSVGARLSKGLRGLPAGKQDWSAYQELCQDILEYLFCPPLSSPLRERGNHTKINRRDIILPNYAETGFWRFARGEYRADYVVVDAKNYSQAIRKEQVLQIANYLQRHGVGLFAMIMCRAGFGESAFYTLREQWILHDKMIIILQDDDVLQMLAVKSGGGDPSELIRQKIEDFRLEI
ncbi:hypothetical protein ACWDV7_16510 [Streptomyces sp. NPDC003362]